MKTEEAENIADKILAECEDTGIHFIYADEFMKKKIVKVLLAAGE